MSNKKYLGQNLITTGYDAHQKRMLHTLDKANPRIIEVKLLVTSPMNSQPPQLTS